MTTNNPTPKDPSAVENTEDLIHLLRKSPNVNVLKAADCLQSQQEKIEKAIEHLTGAIQANVNITHEEAMGSIAEALRELEK